MYAARVAFVTACARIQSDKFLVRIAHPLYRTPAINPTSQKGPCSDANRMAVSQKDTPEYLPKPTLRKSGSIRYRINQPRQNNSSTIGTTMAVPNRRNVRKRASVLRGSGIELVAV